MCDETMRDPQATQGATNSISAPLGPLATWGWNEEWARKAADQGAAFDWRASQAGDVPDSTLLPGRVIRHVHHHYHLITPASVTPVAAVVSGAFAYRAVEPADFPTAGDWVLCRNGRIEAVLPRRGAISRNAAGGETIEQIIVANIDVDLLVFGLDGGRNFTAGMLERSLVAAWNSGGRPVIVLNKADCADGATIDRLRVEAESNAPGVPVHVVSAQRGDGLDTLLAEIRPAETAALLGKSGVGKSALLNAFVQRAVPTAAPPARTGEQRRGDLQGRHTTSDKVLHLLPSGAILADVPGLRELRLWGAAEDLSTSFPEIDDLAAECRFRDCAHTGEPGCRVQEALATGELPAQRFERYLEYRDELAYLERRRDHRAAADEQRKWKQIAMEIRRVYKNRRG